MITFYFFSEITLNVASGKWAVIGRRCGSTCTLSWVRDELCMFIRLSTVSADLHHLARASLLLARKHYTRFSSSTVSIRRDWPSFGTYGRQYRAPAWIRNSYLYFERVCGKQHTVRGRLGIGQGYRAKLLTFVMYTEPSPMDTNSLDKKSLFSVHSFSLF